METLVATDLDGTLWGLSEQCHPKTLAAIKEVQASTTSLIAATGRRQRSAFSGFTTNNLALPAVLLNGAYGFDFLTETAFHAQSFSEREVRRILDCLNAINVSPTLYNEADQVISGLQPSASSSYLQKIGDRLVQTADVQKYVAASEHNILGMTVVATSKAEMEKAAATLHSIDHTDFSVHLDAFHSGWMMMIQPNNVSKWSGINSYIKSAGRKVDRVIAIGDSTNDISMLERADIAVGVEGGVEEVLALADVIISHPDSGGWAEVLDLL